MKYLLTAGKFCKKRDRIKQILDDLFNPKSEIQKQNEFINDYNIKLEAKKTCDELFCYASNIINTNEFIANYETALEFNKSGLLISQNEAELRAQKRSEEWIDCDFIRNGIILKGIVEGMKREIEKANFAF